MLSQDVACQITADDRGTWAEQVGRVLRSGERAFLRLCLLQEDGQLLLVSGTLGLWWRSGQAPQLRLILRPLPETLTSPQAMADRVQESTAELQRSRLLLQEAQRIAGVGSWSLDLRRGELLWSDEIYRIFELDPEAFEPSYDTFLSCVQPDDRRKVDEAYSRSLVDRQPYEVTHRLLMPDGRVKVIIESCETSFSAEGEPLLSIGTARDITEQTLARQQLEQSERKLRSLVKLAPFAIVLSSIDGELLEWNEAFVGMIGSGPGQDIPVHLSTLVPEHQRQSRSGQYPGPWRPV